VIAVVGGPYGFGAPGFLALMALALVAWGATVWWVVWRARARARFGGLAPERGARSYLAPAAVIVAIALAAFAAARPQAGERDVAADEQAVDVAVVLDVSDSMLAGDVPPTRLALAQQEVDALLDRMRGGRAGLVIFAGNAFARAPLTSDLRALRAIVDAAGNERGLVQPGSDLGGAIVAAQRMLTGSGAARAGDRPLVMLIVSDGEDRAARVTQALSLVRGSGIRIDAAGVGTGDGAPVRDIDPATGALRDRTRPTGEVVKTRLNEATLREATEAGGGRYIALGAPGQSLASLAADYDGLARRVASARAAPERVERFQFVAALALVLVVAVIAVPPLVHRRRESLRRMLRVAPLAGGAVLIAGLCTTSVATLNRRGNTEYALANYDRALALYRTAQARDPDAPEPRVNAGNALDRQGALQSAIDETRRALPAKDKALEAIIEYQLGNHYAGASLFADALEAYKRALLAAPGDEDAKHNLEIVQAKISPTPAPSATATSATEPPAPGATPQPDQTPAPGSSPGPAPPGSSGSNGQVTPGPGQPQPSQGTPAAGTPEPDPRGALERALGEPGRAYSEEEARRILDLLQQANQGALSRDLQRVPGPSTARDY